MQTFLEATGGGCYAVRMMKIRYLVTAGALLAIIAALPVPAAGQNDAHGVTKFNGVWDAYGGISCREGDASPEVLTIREGTIEGTIQTTDNSNRMFGKIDRFGQMTAYVNGQYTLMEFHAVIDGEEGYGPATAIGDDVDCDGAWTLKRRSDPNIPHVHQPRPGAAPVKITADFRRDAWRWNTRRRFEDKFKALTRIAEDKRIKAIVESR